MVLFIALFYCEGMGLVWLVANPTLLARPAVALCMLLAIILGMYGAVWIISAMTMSLEALTRHDRDQSTLLRGSESKSPDPAAALLRPAVQSNVEEPAELLRAATDHTE